MDAEQRCKTCRWWEDYSEEGYSKNEHHPHWGSCNRFDSQDENPFYPDAPAMASALAGDYAGLFTSPDFGCVQWQAKEPA